MTSEGNRATGAMRFGFDPVVVHNNSHLVHDGHLVQPIPAGGFSWNHAHGVPYLQDIGLHGYQVGGINAPAFMLPSRLRPHRGSHNVYQPPLPPQYMMPVQAQNMDIHLQSTSTSHRHSTRTSGAYSIQNDPGPRFVGGPPPHGMMVYEPRLQHRNFPRLRVLPEEAFLALREQLGNTDSGLPVKFISDHLKTRTFASFRHRSQDLTPTDEEPNFCVICQMEFEDQEKIGMLDCGHEYHVKCIKKWLTVKNNCPVCKSTALR